MSHYPHFGDADTDVWSKYLADPVVPITEVWYDVHVGNPVNLPELSDEMDKRIALGLTRKRIDVVAKVGGGYWIIEVKPVADQQALGQIINYTRLFRSEFNVPGEVFPVIVADEVDLNVIGSFEDLGVLVVVN